MTHTLPQNLTNSKPLEPRRVVLLQAADYIRTHGWCQNSLTTKDGAVCAMGSVYGAAMILDPKAGDYTDGNEIVDFYARSIVADKALHLLDEHLDAQGYSKPLVGNKGLAPYWNDDPNRTKEEVIAGLTSAAFHNLDVTP